MGKKTVGVGAGGVGIGVSVGAGLVLTQDDRSSAQAVMITAGNRNRLLPPPKPLSASLRGRMAERGTSPPWSVMRWRILLPLKTV
ncbi:MAG: hypothetical protein E3J30_00690 [Anaerolineales bacterium]|nr:MAG: hypothetical protein E3J30_00690 [Anaerolineales bacterium]